MKNIEAMESNLALLPNVEDLDKVDPDAAHFIRGMKNKQLELQHNVAMSSAEKKEEILGSGIEELAHFLRARGIAGGARIDSLISSYLRHGASLVTSKLMSTMKIPTGEQGPIMDKMGKTLDPLRNNIRGKDKRGGFLGETPSQTLAGMDEADDEGVELSDPSKGFHAYNAMSESSYRRYAQETGIDDLSQLRKPHESTKIQMKKMRVAKKASIREVQERLDPVIKSAISTKRVIEKAVSKASKRSDGAIRISDVMKSKAQLTDTVKPRTAPREYMSRRNYSESYLQ